MKLNSPHLTLTPPERRRCYMSDFLPNNRVRNGEQGNFTPGKLGKKYLGQMISAVLSCA